jgi:hypothetical protein
MAFLILKYIKQVPVVVVTAYPEGTKYLEPGALLCIPFGEEELIALIRRLTRRPTPRVSIPMPRGE